MPGKPEGASSCVSVAAWGSEKTSLFARWGSVGGCGEARGHEQFRWLCPPSRLLLLPAHGGRRLLDARRKVSRRLLFQRRYNGRARRIARPGLAAWMEHAARGRVGWRGPIAREQEAGGLWGGPRVRARGGAPPRITPRRVPG